MKKSTPPKVLLSFAALIVLVIALSAFSMTLWGGSEEKIDSSQTLTINTPMTVAEFGEANSLPDQVLTEALGVSTPADFQKQLDDLGLDKAQITTQVTQALALYAEESSKNWIKIGAKFALWAVFLVVVFVMTRKGWVTTRTRTILYAVSIVIFGLVLGSDPSPMGTVKDAIVLYGSKGIVFRPRLVSFSVFLATVLLANKFICAWGCQFGVLQDLIFRLNSRPSKKSLFRHYKVPFVVTNTIRVAFFVLLTLAAFGWAFDIVGQVDPFKIYNPAVVTVLGWSFIAAMLGLSLFIYRPWCHLFCPFGLVGWLVEKVSIFKIRVDYEACTGCQACAKACPSTAMDAILRRETTIPDCFACSACINVCPTDAISFSAGKRTLPPSDLFVTK